MYSTHTSALVHNLCIHGLDLLIYIFNPLLLSVDAARVTLGLFLQLLKVGSGSKGRLGEWPLCVQLQLLLQDLVVALQLFDVSTVLFH